MVFHCLYSYRQVGELFHCKVLNILWRHPLSIRVMETMFDLLNFLNLWYDVISGKLPIPYHIDHDRNYYDKKTWYMLDNVDLSLE